MLLILSPHEIDYFPIAIGRRGSKKSVKRTKEDAKLVQIANKGGFSCGDCLGLIAGGKAMIEVRVKNDGRPSLYFFGCGALFLSFFY